MVSDPREHVAGHDHDRRGRRQDSASRKPATVCAEPVDAAEAGAVAAGLAALPIGAQSWRRQRAPWWRSDRCGRRWTAGPFSCAAGWRWRTPVSRSEDSRSGKDHRPALLPRALATAGAPRQSAADRNSFAIFWARSKSESSAARSAGVSTLCSAPRDSCIPSGGRPRRVSSSARVKAPFN